MLEQVIIQILKNTSGKNNGCISSVEQISNRLGVRHHLD